METPVFLHEGCRALQGRPGEVSPKCPNTDVPAGRCVHVLLDPLTESPRAHLHVVGMLRFMSDINQPSVPTPFFFFFKFCSCVHICLCGPFNYISFHKFSRQLSVFSLCSSSLVYALVVLSTIYLFLEKSASALVLDGAQNTN